MSERAFQIRYDSLEEAREAFGSFKAASRGGPVAVSLEGRVIEVTPGSPLLIGLMSVIAAATTGGRWLARWISDTGRAAAPTH
jgi:hypothetical protein